MCKTASQISSRYFLNIRLRLVEIITQSSYDIRKTITSLVKDYGNPFLTGICCINMDEQVSDAQVSAILETAFELRKQYSTESGS